ncbi:AAA family ATPase [Tumidithrix elongata RA019]|uniref:AAA family ATPase n=1 Tax=Tumidithrix elongata BACA0141 TaxID=2716417 RepID=A0AAW9Q3E8_9CYAN|nr:AAA family ATPase [Tumidithrix elongata RA019]
MSVIKLDVEFNPEYCRNETEVESKLIVQYLLPKLGYSPETWHQEVSFGSIRLDFLAFASQVLPFKLNADSPLSIVFEAKHPKQKLDNHVIRLKRYLVSLNVRYGILTNGKVIRIYERSIDNISLRFQCNGKEINSRIDEIKAIIGRESLQQNNSFTVAQTKEISDNLAKDTLPDLTETIGVKDSFSLRDGKSTKIPQVSKPVPLEKRAEPMKTIAIYHNKGGVGKTTTVVNLAAAIRKKGKRVLVVDLDSQANTTFATGLVKFEDEEFDDIEESNILHILQSEDFYTIEEVARKSDFSDPSINVVPAHINLMNAENELNQLDYSRMILAQKLKDVGEQYDVVILDTPPSLNLYARVALIACDYLIIPSDLKPYANQGLVNVKEFIKKVNGFRKQINKNPIQILGVLPNKISTNARFVQYTLPTRLQKIPAKYELELMDSIIYDRDDLAKCAEMIQIVGDLEVADPKSIFEFKPDSMAAQEFELLAIEVLEKIGMSK